MIPPMRTLLVATAEQSYLLSELHMTHGRLVRLLEKVRDNAARSLEYSTLDTLFLLGSTAQLPECVATYEALRHAALLGGCSREQVIAACVTDHLIIEVSTGQAPS